MAPLKFGLVSAHTLIHLVLVACWGDFGDPLLFGLLLTTVNSLGIVVGSSAIIRIIVRMYVMRTIVNIWLFVVVLLLGDKSIFDLDASVELLW